VLRRCGQRDRIDQSPPVKLKVGRSCHCTATNIVSALGAVASHRHMLPGMARSHQAAPELRDSPFSGPGPQRWWPYTSSGG